MSVGIVLETLSNKKLSILAVILLLIQIIFYLLGGIIAPAPNTADQLSSVICVRDIRQLGVPDPPMLFPRSSNGLQCNQTERIDASMVAEQVVFAIQLPLPRDSIELEMSRWFQGIASVLEVEMKYEEHHQKREKVALTMDLRLAYRNHGDPEDQWTQFASSRENRSLQCKMDQENEVECDMFPLFELGTCHHDFYLLNIMLPEGSLNQEIGRVEEFNMILIHANGGFTQVWFLCKTFVFPLVLAVLAWFYLRVRQLNRQANLIEKTIFFLGTTMSLLNLPIEWFTLVTYMPYMSLYADIRQSIFYSAMLCFWVIFTGEHKMDQQQRNKLSSYWKPLSVILTCSLALLLFELCERGVQLSNPFHSIWSTSPGSEAAYIFVVIACISACLYFVYLTVSIGQALRNIYAKKSALQHFSKPRRRYYKALIYRFNFLLLSTIFCAAMTIVYFIVGQFNEGYWKWGQTQFQYNSAFLTGVYGMWNIYVSSLLMLYAPSHKTKPIFKVDGDSSDEDDAAASMSADVTPGAPLKDLIPGAGESSVLMSFVNKSSVD